MISCTEGLVVYYLWGGASHFAGGHFQNLDCLLEVIFGEGIVFPGGLFLVVQSSNEHKLKLYVTAINKTVD